VVIVKKEKTMAEGKRMGKGLDFLLSAGKKKTNLQPRAACHRHQRAPFETVSFDTSL